MSVQEITAEYVNRVLNSSVGSEVFYKRENSSGMDYTEGVMEFQRKLNAYWLIDVVYSYIDKVLEDFNKTEETFYVVTLDVNEDHTAVFKISKEQYNNDTEDYENIAIAEQEIPYTDLPQCQVKFFLELANFEPTIFRLLCPCEH